MAAHSKIDALFTKTKEICFGRYILTVPAEAMVSYGENEISGQPSMVYPNRARDIKTIAAQMVQEIKDEAPFKDAIFDKQGAGPIANSWYLWFSASETKREFGDHTLLQLVPIGNDVLKFGSWYTDRSAKRMVNDQQLLQAAEAQNEPRNEKEAWDKIMPLIKLFRPRDEHEIPKEAGFCLPRFFVSDSSYKRREQVEMGIRLPSLPDVSFSISSKNFGSLEGDNGWGILQRQANQQKLAGHNYDFVFLRKGKAPLNTWQNGEELLGKHKSSGAHEFLWSQVGKLGQEGSITNPNELDARLYSKVDDDTVGAAKSISITDDEAIELWDRLLKSFQFRVPIKYVPSLSVNVGDICPQTGMWFCQGVSSEQGIYMRKGDPMPGQSYNKTERAKMQWHLIKPMGDDV